MGSAEPVLGHETLLYAQVTKPDTDKPYFGFFPSRVHFITCWKEPVVRVKVTVDESGDYWAWWDAADGRPCHIFPRRFLVEMCFTYGPEVEEELGMGRICRVRVEEASE